MADERNTWKTSQFRATASVRLTISAENFNLKQEEAIHHNQTWRRLFPPFFLFRLLRVKCSFPGNEKSQLAFRSVCRAAQTDNRVRLKIIRKNSPSTLVECNFSWRGFCPELNKQSPIFFEEFRSFFFSCVFAHVRKTLFPAHPVRLPLFHSRPSRPGETLLNTR